MQKHRIIYVWNYREWGGAQIYFLSLMKAAKGKYDVAAMLPSDSDRKVLDYLDGFNVPYRFLAPAPSMLGTTGILGRLSRRIALWRSESALVEKIAVGPDLENTVVHIDMGFWQSCRPLYRLSKMTNVVMTLHTALPPVNRLRALIWKAKGRLISREKDFHLMASNEDAKRGVRPYVSDEAFDSIAVAYSGFDPSEMESVHADNDALRRKFGIAYDLPLIVTSGQFIERKGCWTVLESLRKLKSNSEEFAFLWLGTSTPDAESLKRVNEYDLGDSFRLLSPEEIGPTRNDLLGVVAAADIFVLASTQEGLPISLVEAMALGRPCIATRVGAIPEALRDAENGLLLEPNDPEAVSAAISELIRNRERRHQFGQAASATARAHFDAAKWAEKVMKFYDSIWQ